MLNNVKPVQCINTLTLIVAVSEPPLDPPTFVSCGGFFVNEVFVHNTMVT